MPRGKKTTMGSRSGLLGATSTLIGTIAVEAADAAPLEDGNGIKLSAFLRFLLGLPPDDDDDAIVGLWDLNDGVAGGPPPSFLMGSMGEEEEEKWWLMHRRACRWQQRSASSSTLSLLCSPSEYCGCCCRWEKWEE